MDVNGNAIREKRWDMQYSVRQLGGLVGISRTQMTNIELRSQKTSRKNALRIARALKCKLKEIL